MVEMSWICRTRVLAGVVFAYALIGAMGQLDPYPVVAQTATATPTKTPKPTKTPSPTKMPSPSVSRPAPKAGGLPLEVAGVLVGGGVAAFGGGALMLRRDRQS